MEGSRQGGVGILNVQLRFSPYPHPVRCCVFDAHVVYVVCTEGTYSGHSLTLL